MTIIEEFAANKLREFMVIAEKDGFCFNGSEIDEQVQDFIMNIVSEYIKKLEHEF